MHRRICSNCANRRKFAQPIKREYAVRVSVGIGSIVVNVIHCQIGHLCIAGYLAETGVTMWIPQVVGWLALQMNACGRDKRNTALGKWFTQMRPAYRLIRCEVGPVMHFSNELEPATKTFIQVRSWHS